jgi:serine protease Do
LVAAASVSLSACRRDRGAAPTHTTGAELPAPPSSLVLQTPPVLPGTPDVPSLVLRVRPGVVNITTTQELRSRGPFDPFEFFFGQRRPTMRGGGDSVVKRRALGSGFIVDSRGHVVTNAHVVAGAAAVRVTLADGRELSAVVKGNDERLDVALLELQGAKDLPFVALGSSDATRVGEYVVAIGNPFGLGDTVTMGIVSAKGRELGAGPYDDFIQTDASINPGNSGGPLFNLRGEVIGINAAINPEGRGIGFAIPIDALREVLPQLEATGSVQRGRLGVMIQPVDADIARALDLPGPAGALVNEVEPGGPASAAGLEPGDVILRVDQRPVATAHDLPRLVAVQKPGTVVTLDVLGRAKGRRSVRVKLAAIVDEHEKATNEAAPAPGNDRREREHPSFGMSLTDNARGGVVVSDVDPTGPVSDLLEPGDVVVEVDQARVKNAKDAAERIRLAEERPALLKVERNGRPRFVAIRRR